MFLLLTCRHLLQNSSMTLDTMSDLTRDILELADNDITDKVTKLAHRFILTARSISVITNKCFLLL